jgi:cytoskeletal protein CcmA (bactofilin family)
MWTPADSKTPQSARTNAQPLTPAPAETPGTPSRATSSTHNQHSFIGKSIVIKGEIEAADPVYIYGRVEGLINAPAHRVTVGKDGKVEADINAREVVIMGEVRGNLNGGDRVEIRTEGSLTGDLAAHRICIEDGAFLNGKIDVRKTSEQDKAEAQDEAYSALGSEESTEGDHPALETAVAG